MPSSPKHPKTWYWIGLAAATLLAAFLRRDIIWRGDLSHLDEGLLVFLALVLLLPLVSEFEGFGFKLKSSLEELKQDIARQFVDIRAAIQNNVRIENRVGSQDPAELRRLIQEINQESEAATIAAPQLPDVVQEVPPEHLELFAVRYAIERELTRIAGLPLDTPNSQWWRRMRGLVDTLARSGQVLKDTPSAYAEVRQIANRATHGQAVSADEVDFVRQVAPKILGSLRGVPTPAR